MTEKRREIHGRIYKFVLAILNSVKIISKASENIILVKQLVRSAAAIGANALEADGSETKKEFIHRFTISKKEAKETHYWLSLISDHNPSIKAKLSPLLDESRQLVLIISKIIINTKRK